MAAAVTAADTTADMEAVDMAVVMGSTGVAVADTESMADPMEADSTKDTAADMAADTAAVIMASTAADTEFMVEADTVDMEGSIIKPA